MSLKEKSLPNEKTFERPILIILLAVIIILTILIIDLFNNNSRIRSEYKYLYQKNESIKK
jgi:hypothetical protein